MEELMNFLAVVTVFSLFAIGAGCDAKTTPPALPTPTTPTVLVKPIEPQPTKTDSKNKAKTATKATKGKNTRPVPKAKYIPPPPASIKGK